MNMSDMNMMGGMPRPDNHEAAMARADLYKLANYSFKLFKMIKDGDELEGWVQAKVTKAADYIASVYHFMEYEMKFSEYGEKLETADVYTESVKREYMRKLTEARVKLEKLRKKNIADLNEGWDDMMKASKERGEKEKKEKGTDKFDVKKTSTGTAYTRKASTFDDGKDDKREAEKKQQRKDDRAAKKASQSSVKETVAVQQTPQKMSGKVTPAKGPGETAPGIGKQPTKHTGKNPTPQHVDEPVSKVKEALKGRQKNLDVDKDGKLEKSDFKKLRASKDVKEAEERTMSRAGKGVMKYGKEGMKALAKAGKEGKSLDSVRKKYDKYDEAAKPDFLDVDKDKNQKEPMKKALADKKKQPFGKK